MSIISRLTTWTAGQVLRAVDLNGEFSNITNLLNNLDAATTTWTNVKVTTLSPQSDVTVLGNVIFSPTTKGVKGTTTNDSPAAGNVGEVISSFQTVTNSPTTTQWGDLTSISLTAGDWDLTVRAEFILNTATGYTTGQIGAGYTSGNNNPDISGNSTVDSATAPLATSAATGYACLSNVRVSLAITTIVYLKVKGTYTGGQLQDRGIITARRMR